MPQIEKLHFDVHIDAPIERVWQLMLAADSYTDWTASFCEGSYFEGSWEEGQRIRFRAPSGEGMVAEIAENRPYERLSIRHLGHIAKDGSEDTESPAIKAWAPAYENYTFSRAGTGTDLHVDQDMNAEYAEHMRQTWPKALQRLKELSERDSDSEREPAP